jgi:[ribosomal protein S5]-alanine N-acetyltransferase
MPQLQSARLGFRPCCAADLKTLLAHWRDPQVRRFLFDDLEVAPEQVGAFVQTSEALFQAHRYGLWCLTDLATGEFRGVCGLWQGEPALLNPAPELLISIQPVSWGQGLATESSRTVLQYGFQQCRLPEVSATVDPPNLASISLLEKLNFHQQSAQTENGRTILVYRLWATEFSAYGL